MVGEREAETASAGCGGAIRLDRESCRAFRVTPEESEALVSYACGVLADVIASEESVTVNGFGSFKVRPYRLARPDREALDSSVEVPYLGPVDFSASALLIRQLRLGALERSVVPRSDALYSAIRKDNRVPRGQIPHLIKAVFRALTVSLIKDNLVSLPGIGCLVVRQRPPTVRYNVETEAIEVFPGDPALFLRSSSPFLMRVMAGHRTDVDRQQTSGQGHGQPDA